jgi:hypothetical protein
MSQFLPLDRGLIEAAFGLIAMPVGATGTSAAIRALTTEAFRA